MHRKSLAFLFLLAIPPATPADGCKFTTDGRLVPEREQRAMVEWADGVETLHVAALSDPTAGGSVWVVPVRAAAAAVRAEPVEAFPAVVYYETVRRRAELTVLNWAAAVGLLDSGGLCCPLFMGGCGSDGGPPSAVEASRVERLGMVVTVVSAESRAEIERYLDAQGVNRAAADLSSLDPYFGLQGHCFVCGWVASQEVPARAAGLTVVFPSPTLWFPLRPTRAYAHPVETVVYARGFVKPAAGCDLPQLACKYVYGEVKPLGVGQTFGSDRLRDNPGYYPSTRLVPLTRVTLTTDPRQWACDLELVPGTTPAGMVAVALTGWVGLLGPLWSGLLGAALGLLIPWLTVPKAERRRTDWLAGALTGAAIVLSIWASAIVFAVWRGVRFRGRPKRPSRYVVLPALAVAHFGIAFGVCQGLIAWLTTSG